MKHQDDALFWLVLTAMVGMLAMLCYQGMEIIGHLERITKVINL